jgi:fructose-1,6-bisphosphatase I
VTQRTTLTQFLHEGQRHVAGATGDFTGLVADVAVASKTIANAVGRGALLATGDGLAQQLRTLAADLFLELVSATSHLSATLSRDDDAIRETGTRGRYLLTFVPLSSSSNLDINYQTGTIFSILRAPDPDRPAREDDFLQPAGRWSVRAWCSTAARHGSCSTTRLGVDGFTLDRELGEYVLTHPDVTVPAACDEVSVHAVGSRRGSPPSTATSASASPGRTAPAGGTSACGGPPRSWPTPRAS